MRAGVAGGPAVVVGVDGAQDVVPGFGRGEEVVTPVGGELAGEAGVLGVGDEPPAGLGLQAKHVGSLCSVKRRCDWMRRTRAICGGRATRRT